MESWPSHLSHTAFAISILMKRHRNIADIQAYEQRRSIHLDEQTSITEMINAQYRTCTDRLLSHTLWDLPMGLGQVTSNARKGLSAGISSGLQRSPTTGTTKSPQQNVSLNCNRVILITSQVCHITWPPPVFHNALNADSDCYMSWSLPFSTSAGIESELRHFPATREHTQR